MTKLYLDILDDERKRVFAKLKSFNGTWVLAGGTALALQIGHRKSINFDLFSPKPISLMLYHSICDVFGESPVKLVHSEDQLTIALSSGIKLTFLYYWFPFQFPTISTESIALADIRDIAADKACVLGKRNVWRDYVDLYVILKDGYMAINDLIVASEKKFGHEFSSKLFLEQLSYTDDIHDTAVSFVSRTETADEMKRFLEQTAIAYAQKVILR
ncbi:MAG: nucleotidyl transferase AbiEii/AbiGii toxin family protein [bacterium]